MSEPFHPLNWYAGWTLIVCAFVTGAGIGLFFHRDDFWGGYNSFRRRVVRLGHIALAALGMMNVLFSLSPWPASGSMEALVGSWGLLCGAVAMPLVCFLTGWRKEMRYWFVVPVAALLSAVIAILTGAGG